MWCFTNIAALAKPGEFQDPCGYALGQYFPTRLYDAMELAAFSSAMREIYERYLDYQYHPTEEQVYRIFLKHTPPDREVAFQDVYRRLHGGPFLGGERVGMQPLRRVRSRGLRPSIHYEPVPIREYSATDEMDNGLPAMLLRCGQTVARGLGIVDGPSVDSPRSQVIDGA